MSGFSVPTLFKASEVFGASGFTKDDLVLGWTKPEGDKLRGVYIPRIEDYEFRKDSLRTLVSFLCNPNREALFISGPTGSGKTSMVLQAAARLNWGVREISCSERLEFADMVGSYVLMSNPAKPDQAPEMKFRHGMLPTAMRNGDILLLNEVDMADPGQMSALNTVLEGGCLEIRETGEVIEPHPMFRLICTGNSAGQGDRTGRYQGVLSQNMATMDRYRFVVVDYLEARIEKKLLGKLGLPEEVLNPMIQVATSVRKDFVAGHLGVTFSTRTLLRWGRLILERRDWKGEKAPISHALQEAILFRVSDPDEVAIIKKQVELAFPEGTPLSYR